MPNTDFYTPAEYNPTSDVIGGQESYIKSMQNQFAQETETGRRSFTRTAEDAATQAKQFSEDYARYTGRDQQEKTRQLASTSKQFATALSNAADAYGQRGLLNSGIAIKNAQAAVGDLGLAQQQINTAFQNAGEDRNIALAREQQRYGLTSKRLGEDLSTYGEQRKNLGVQQTEAQKRANIPFNTGVFGVQQGTVENMNDTEAKRMRMLRNPLQVGAGQVQKIY